MGRAWLPLYVGDYLRDTRDLNTLQHGAYLLLIMHYWQHDGLPSDDARLAAIAGLTVAQWRRIREPVQAKFTDGSPAVTLNKVGKGSAMYVGFLPGLTYFWPAMPLRPMDRGATDDAMTHFLP